MLPLFQLVLKLIGDDLADDDGDDTFLDMYSGRAMALRRRIGCGWENAGRKGTSRPGEVAQWSYSLHLFVYCEEWEKATEMYNKIADMDIGALRSFPMWHNRVFFMALVALQSAKSAPWIKKRKWMRAFEKYFGMMQMWVLKRKALNLVHKFQLLEVLKLTVDQGRKNPSDSLLQAAVDRAIFPALRAGQCQDAGLGAALAASAVQNWDAKLRYAALAQHCYGKWGAHGVVKHLRRKYRMHDEVEVSAYFYDLPLGKDHRRSRDLTPKKEVKASAEPRKVSIRSKERFSSVNVPMMQWDGKDELSEMS